MKVLFDELTLKCSKLTTNSYSTSFSLGIKFLDSGIHDEIYAIYGFVRFADEIVDTFHGYPKEELLQEFKSETYRAIKRGISLNPILNSFQWVVNKYSIDHELIDCFLESMNMDLEEKVYDRSLYEKYILGSAQVVGLMCLKVFVDGDERQYLMLKPFAMSLGAAFQKINFLRDYANDSKDLGRIYFPQLSSMQLTNNSKDEILKEITRDFDHAFEGIKQLPSNSRLGVYLAYIYYKDLLSKIAKSSVDTIVHQRIRISNFKKILLAIKAFLQFKLFSKFFICLMIMFFSLPISAHTKIEDLRKAYIDCDTSKNMSLNFLELAQKSDLSLIANQAYLIAAKLVNSKFQINPITKLNSFLEAKKDLEAMIKANPGNLELRYIRLAAQNASPKFLSYKDNIDEDKKLLLKYLESKPVHEDFEINVKMFLRDRLKNI